MESTKKKALLEEFRTFLENDYDEILSDTVSNKGQVDLYSLFSELLIIKNEVRSEARQFNSALEQFRTLLEQLQSDKLNLTAELVRCREQEQTQSRNAMRPLLLQLLELRDRIEAGVKAAENYRPKRLTRLSRRREVDVINALKEGQALTLARLDQLLASFDVLPVQVLDQQLDPHSMRAAELDQQADFADGLVTAECRKGFFWGSEVLRVAEVKVNKG